MNRETVDTYVERQLAPTLSKGDVLGPLTRTVAYGYSDRWRNLGDRSGRPPWTTCPATKANALLKSSESVAHDCFSDPSNSRRHTHLT